jgi:hypothetical protein
VYASAVEPAGPKLKLSGALYVIPLLAECRNRQRNEAGSFLRANAIWLKMAWRRTSAGSSTGIKTLVSRRFSNKLSPPFFPPSLFTFLHRRLVPQAALSSTYSLPGPLGPRRTDTTRPVEKCRTATADSHSLDASAALSRRPSDPCVDPWTMTPVKRPALQQSLLT